MKELIRQISQSLVDNADKVEVTEVIGDQSYIIELRVAKEDVGKVIGRQGRTAQAIRTILSAVSAKAHKRAFLEILD
ncbi:MAG: KH domain-containing protein [Deltaproteobacteria bacterium]|nr:KH domain-containing protein [Deltaproteobacteria bacterium]